MSDINVQSGINFSNTYNSKAVMIVDGHDIEYWIKEFTLPSMSLEHISVERTPAKFNVEGNIWTFDDFNVQFYVDEHFSSYYRLYSWLWQSLPGPDFKPMKADAKILLLNNQLTEILSEIRFVGLMIKNLAEFTYNNYENTPLSMNIGFTYDRIIPNFKKATIKN